MSAKELFKYRHGLEKTVPEKGGSKDYMPQGTWLENKRLEKFYEETEQVLAEPRIQRKGDWVKGTWLPDRQLVELHHEMRNFWQHMGFGNREGKWLYPEEALFLIEINVLEMWYRGVPLSIQEAYSLLLDSTVSVGLYQVYCHLRRIGYVVLRHRGRYNFTNYERKIGLDKYVDKTQKRKDKRKSKKSVPTGGGQSIEKEPASLEQDMQGVNDTKNREQEHSDRSDFSVVKDLRCSDKQEEEEQSNITAVDEEEPEHETQFAHQSSPKKFTDDADMPEVSGCPSSAVGKQSDAGDHSGDSPKDNRDMDKDNIDDLRGSYSIIQDSETNRTNTGFTSLWNFEEFNFPDFGISSDNVVVAAPCNCSLIGNIELKEDEYNFDRRSWINNKREKKKDKTGSRSLNFSYADQMGAGFGGRDTCKNWKEFKDRKGKESRQKVAPHLYRDGISPLVKPELATSTASVLDQLMIVEETKLNKRPLAPDIMPDFDVYLPNMKFKKSMPGLPDHRVCVTSCSDSPPGLDVVTAITSYLEDNVPLHWAVVDDGDIAFFNIADHSLPTDITMG